MSSRIAELTFVYKNGGRHKDAEESTENLSEVYGEPTHRFQEEDGIHVLWEKPGISIVLASSIERGLTLLGFRNEKVYKEMLSWRNSSAAQEQARRLEEERRRAEALWERDFGNPPPSKVGSGPDM